MSESYKQQLDLAFDLRHQRRRQYEAEQAQSRRAIEDAHAKLERLQVTFHGKVRSLMEQAVAEANLHLATRSERCRLCDVSGHFTGPWYPGGAVCNPIAYELEADGEPVGEALLLELTQNGMVKASLCTRSPDISHAHVIHQTLGWPVVVLDEFSASTASDFVLRYVTAVATRNLH